MAKKPKRVARSVQPNPQKVTKWLGATAYDGGPLAWRFGSHDKGGPFPFTGVTSGKLTEIVEKLCAYETMSVTQMRKQGCHDLPTTVIAKNAQARLDKIKLDDVERLYSFRIQKIERLWCWRHENLMIVLWWDPLHLVYPMDVTGNRHRRRR